MSNSLTKRALNLLALLIFSSIATPLYAQRLEIDIGGADFRPYPIAAPAIRYLGEKEAKTTKQNVDLLSNLLQWDIKLARSLELVNPKSYLAPERESLTSPKYLNWINVGASGLIRASAQPIGNKLKLTFRFFDTVGQRKLLEKTYTVRAKNGDWAVHQFLDLVVETLTGELGVFNTQIAYVKRTSKGKAIYVTNMDGKNERRITDSSTLSLLPAWDKSGSKLLFTSYMRGNPDLFRIDLATEKLDWLSNKRGLNTGAAVSPDGKKIALTLSIDGNTEIYVMNSQGKNLTRLTDSWGQDVSPTWSPNGSQIAFVSSRSGNPHIYVMNSDGSNPRRLTFRGDYNQEPDWSPRAGGQIAFTARDERLKYDIFLVHPTSGELTRLTQDQGNNASPSFSPDGRHIAFTSTRSPHRGTKKLYIMNADGRNQHRILKTAGQVETPSWGPRASSAQ